MKITAIGARLRRTATVAPADETIRGVVACLWSQGIIVLTVTVAAELYGTVCCTSISSLRVEPALVRDTILKTLGLAPMHDFFRALVADGRVLKNAALNFLSPTVVAALLEENVLALHANGAYTAHAQHVASFLRHAGGGAAK